MTSRRRSAPRLRSVLAIVAVLTPALAGCGASEEETTTAPLTVVDVGGTRTRIVTPGTTPAPATTSTSTGDARPALHGVRRAPVRPGADPADLRATDALVEELHDRGRIDRLGLTEMDVAGPVAQAETSRPGRVSAACRAIRAAAVARGLRGLRAVTVRSGSASATFLEDQPGGCRRR